jgi:putative sigma-54 modulation protein
MTIRILINTSEMEMTPHLKEYVEKKLLKLNRLLDNLDEARVELKFNSSVRSASDKHVAQFTVRGKNLLLRAEERSEDIYTSIDVALDKLHRQLEKFKGKHMHVREEHAALDADAEVSRPKAESSSVPVVRRKSFLLEPMNEKEAVEQMQMLGHEEFFLFQNMQNGKINVIYKRRDGSYGLLEPEIR